MTLSWAWECTITFKSSNWYWGHQFSSNRPFKLNWYNLPLKIINILSKSMLFWRLNALKIYNTINAYYVINCKHRRKRMKYFFETQHHAASCDCTQGFLTYAAFFLINRFSTEHRQQLIFHIHLKRKVAIVLQTLCCYSNLTTEIIK